MNIRTRVILLLVLSLAASVGAQTTQPTTKPDKTIRLLTVGNSFAGNSTKFLRDLARAAGDEVILGSANPGGCSLEKHWKAVEAYEANPADPAGQLYVVSKTEKTSLHALLVKEPWDYVTIQQYSMLSDDPKTYFPYADNLKSYIHKHAPSATIVMHQTWAYRQDNSRFTKGGSPTTMHAAARAAYHAAAEKLKLSLIPVGDAMFAVMSDPKSPFIPDPTFNPKTAVYPALPKDQNTVHVSWRWVKNAKTGVQELIADRQHANTRGCYLGSCVFYEFLFGKSVIGNSFIPAGMSPEDAAMLQRVAHETVVASRTAATTQATASP